MTALDGVLERLDARPAGDNRWSAKCPAHPDRRDSLSVSLGDEDRVLLKCFRGCATEDVVAALGLEMRDLFDETRRNGSSQKEIVATYDYTDEDGELLFQVCRFEPKDFRQRRPDGNGGWDWKLGKTRRVLYRLPEVVKTAKAGGKVAVVEGEKDVEALEAQGLTATCNPGGAGKWRDEYAEPLRGASVGVIADHDEPGRKHAAEVARSLEGIAASVKVLEPAEGCKDVAEHLAAGHSLEELVPLASVAVPKLAELLDGIAATIRRYVVMSDAQRDVVALWVLHAHAIEAADSTPYLAVTSAEKQSGKSRLLEVLAQLVPRPLEAANISDAALFRALGGEGPPATLLFDEFDSIFGPKARDHEDLRGLINAGWRRGAKAWRCVGEGARQEVVPFAVFSAKALAGIGELPETVADRCIPIRLRRRAPDEPVARGRYRDIVAACEPLRKAAVAWAESGLGKLKAAAPELPDALSDRAQDGAEPLLAIADLAGDDWPTRAREAFVELHAGREETSESWGVQLLAAIRVAMEDEDRITTEELLERLKADDEAPWATWGQSGAGLAPRGLARLLAPYGIRSKDIRTSEGTKKGYRSELFEDAWQRYLPPDPVPKRDKGDIGFVEPKTPVFYPRQEAPASRIESGHKPHGNADVADVADRNPDKGAEAASGAEDGDLVREAIKRFGGEE
jgi:hypothetical protein